MQHFFELPEGYKTRMKIIHAVDRPLTQLTVEDLCRKVGISRQTFYNHFSSKMEMPLWYSAFCDEVTLREIGRTLTWREGLLGYFELLRKERTFFSFTLDKMERNRGERLCAAERVEAHFRQTIERNAARSAKEHQTTAAADELDFCLKACSSLIVSIVSNWLDDNMATEPDLMARYTEDCIPPIVYRALKLHG